MEGIKIPAGSRVTIPEGGSPGESYIKMYGGNPRNPRFACENDWNKQINLQDFIDLDLDITVEERHLKEGAKKHIEKASKAGSHIEKPMKYKNKALEHMVNRLYNNPPD